MNEVFKCTLILFTILLRDFLLFTIPLEIQRTRGSDSAPFVTISNRSRTNFHCEVLQIKCSNISIKIVRNDFFYFKLTNHLTEERFLNYYFILMLKESLW